MLAPRRLVSAVPIILIATFCCAEAPPIGDGPASSRIDAGPITGYGGADAAAVWVRPVTPTARVEVRCWPAEERVPAPRVLTPTATAPGSPALVARFTGLAPSTPYRYEVLVDGATDERASGTFRTGPEPGKPFSGRLGVVSCMHPKRHPHQVAWLRLAAEKPDLLLQLGDTIYANSTEPRVIWEWSIAQRQVAEYAAALRAVSTLATWDDHDFGANDSDGTLPGKERSLAVFRELWPNPGSGLEGTPGVFHRASFGDVDIFLLDTRYHRSPNAAPDDEKKRMLGEAQFRWLEEGLRASRATFKLIGCGSTIGASYKDCWKLYSKDAKRLLGLTMTVPGIVFLTGDIHTSLVARAEPGEQAGYPIYEVVSSGVAVNRVTHFFTTIDVDTLARDPTLTVRIHRVNPDGSPQGVDERTIKRSELAPAF